MTTNSNVKRRLKSTAIEQVEVVEVQRFARRLSRSASDLELEEESNDIGEDVRPAPKLVRFRSAYGFAQQYKPVTFLLDPILRSSTVFSLTAGTGSGKTGFMISVALAISSGRGSILNMPVKKGRVVFLSIENPDEFRARLIVSGHRLGVTIGHLYHDFIVSDERCSPEDLYSTLSILSDQIGDVALILIDSLSAMFDGNDLNSAVDAGNFIRRLRPLTTLSGCPAVLIAAHPGKNAGVDDLVPTGSGMIINELDGNLTLKRKPSTGAVILHYAGKMRGLPFDPIEFEFESCTSPHVLDSDARAIPLPVLCPRRSAGPETLAIADDRRSPAMALLSAMLSAPTGPQRQWAAAIGCSQAMIGKRLKKLALDGLATDERGRWSLTAKGHDEAAKWA